MAHKFAEGEVVVLKSGGPPMTVDEVPDATRKTYLTRWFKGASAERGGFGEHLLTKYVPPAKK